MLFPLYFWVRTKYHQLNTRIFHISIIHIVIIVSLVAIKIPLPTLFHAHRIHSSILFLWSRSKKSHKICLAKHFRYLLNVIHIRPPPKSTQHLARRNIFSPFVRKPATPIPRSTRLYGRRSCIFCFIKSHARLRVLFLWTTRYRS